MKSLKEIKTIICSFINQSFYGFAAMVLFVLVAAYPLPAFCDPPEFSFIPINGPVLPGDELLIELKAVGAIDLIKNWKCEFEFDPSMLQVNSIAKGDIAETVIPFGVYGDDAINVDTLKVESVYFGSIDIPDSCLLATFHFETLNSGLNVLIPTYCQYEDADGNIFPVDIVATPVDIAYDDFDEDQDNDIDGLDLFQILQQLSSAKGGEDTATFAASFGAVRAD